MAKLRRPGPILALLVAQLLLGGCQAQPREVAEARPQVLADLPQSLAVVDYESLVKAHPDYERLVQLDEQLRLLNQELTFFPMADERAMMEQGRNEMDLAVKKAQERLMAEKARVEGELAAISRELQGQLEGEIQRLSRDTEARIKQEVGKLKPAAAKEPELPPSDNQAVQEFMENLSLIRERNKAARRLELEKSLRQELESERQRLDAQLSAYEDEVTAKYQDEKLNLQLKLQVANDEEEQQKLQDRLEAIAQELSDLKSARREELDAQFLKIREQKAGAMESELSAYVKELDVEVQHKLAAKRAEVMGTAPPPPQAASRVPDDVKAKIQQIESQARAEFEARKAQMQARMQGEQAEAVRRLKDKQAEIEAELKGIGDEIAHRLKERSQNLSEPTKKKMAALEAEIDKLQKQRDEVRKAIEQDLNAKVAEVAVRKETPMVIGSFVVNRDLDDLTDLAMVAVKQIGR